MLTVLLLRGGRGQHEGLCQQMISQYQRVDLDSQSALPALCSDPVFVAELVDHRVGYPACRSIGSSEGFATCHRPGVASAREKSGTVSPGLQVKGNINTNTGSSVSVLSPRVSPRASFGEARGMQGGGPGTVQEINCAVQPELHETGHQRWTSRTGGS